jgi:P-type E1-E2 ATPase
LGPAGKISERPGRGLTGIIDGRGIAITSRKKFLAANPGHAEGLPRVVGGLECIVLADGEYAGTLRFRDEPRASGRPFIRHLYPKHGMAKVMIVSGDRESEVRYLADKVGIEDVHAGQSPEEKLELVRAETRKASTLFLGDGINDAPALTAATVGIAFGQNSDIASEAADGVVLESSLQKVDELLHIGKRMRTLALQSAVGGMALSLAGIVLAALGMLPPVAGAVAQEAIDVLAIANALRAALTPRALSDFPAA